VKANISRSYITYKIVSPTSRRQPCNPVIEVILACLDVPLLHRSLVSSIFCITLLKLLLILQCIYVWMWKRLE